MVPYMTNELLKNQVTCGGIREELGDESKSSFGHSPSNEAYGSTEASLIFDNGDPVADMLYTTNLHLWIMRSGKRPPMILPM